jgi:hypothetical protein
MVVFPEEERGFYLISSILLTNVISMLCESVYSNFKVNLFTSLLTFFLPFPQAYDNSYNYWIYCCGINNRIVFAAGYQDYPYKRYTQHFIVYVFAFFYRHTFVALVWIVK